MYDHPHPDPAHVMRTYRKFLLGKKREFGMRDDGTINKRAARALIHYMRWLRTYLAAKRLVIESRMK